MISKTSKNQLAASIKLVHPDSNYELLLLTDTSDTHWAAILTRIPKQYRDKNIEELQHELPCFLSGIYNRSAIN